MMQELGEQELNCEETPSKVGESKLENQRNNSIDSRAYRNIDSMKNCLPRDDENSQGLPESYDNLNAYIQENDIVAKSTQKARRQNLTKSVRSSKKGIVIKQLGDNKNMNFSLQKVAMETQTKFKHNKI